MELLQSGKASRDNQGRAARNREGGGGNTACKAPGESGNIYISYRYIYIYIYMRAPACPLDFLRYQ